MVDFISIVFYFCVAVYIFAILATIIAIIPVPFLIIYPVGIVVFTILDAFIQANSEE